ncbi:MAG: low specificity L-threonine aldolase [Dysgonamonadaceae bacterium]|jgi:threonine aldolase|nr:low specificity L-threonine aldolase [Dysgonamonadaceae bacterium]
MKSFASDNNSGVHPSIMDAIHRANTGHAIGYGADEYTCNADAHFTEIFGKDVVPYYVFNGTGANMVALQACTKPFHSIITAETGHINVDECGAPSKFTSCMVKEVYTPDGKLTPELISKHLHGIGDQHHSQPKVIYISQVTELGAVYTAAEIKSICEFAHENDMYVHMDGSRLANAAAYLNTGLRELTRDCGVDILSLGGTKNGMMMGEAVIAFRPELAENLKFIRKQSAQLYSKMRYLSAQYTAYFERDLWLENARQSNDMARELAIQLESLPGIQMTRKVQSNALFLTMPAKTIKELLKSYFFYFWNEAGNEIRLVCSWDTTPGDIESFVSAVRQHL